MIDEKVWNNTSTMAYYYKHIIKIYIYIEDSLLKKSNVYYFVCSFLFVHHSIVATLEFNAIFVLVLLQIMPETMALL